MRIDSLPWFNYAHLPLAKEEAELRTHARDDQGKVRPMRATRAT
jgi:hypothetical protein